MPSKEVLVSTDSKCNSEVRLTIIPCATNVVLVNTYYGTSLVIDRRNISYLIQALQNSKQQHPGSYFVGSQIKLTYKELENRCTHEATEVVCICYDFNSSWVEFVTINMHFVEDLVTALQEFNDIRNKFSISDSTFQVNYIPSKDSYDIKLEDCSMSATYDEMKALAVWVLQEDN